MKLPFLSALLAALSPSLITASPVISEFMASNTRSLQDGHGNYEDWIEIWNPDGTPVNLEGWRLTDSVSDPARYVFPALTLAAGDRVVVFASGQNGSTGGATHVDALGYRHTNFKLSASGEYLGLSRPDGTVVSAFSPTYPVQADDVSYGVTTATQPLITATSPLKALVPAAAFSGTWTGGTEPFDDATWLTGTPGAGFSGSSGVVASANLKLRLNADTAAGIALDTSAAARAGTNSGAVWQETLADVSNPAVTRRGVMQFSAQTGSQVSITASADYNTTQGTIAFWMKSSGMAGSGQEGAILLDRRNNGGNVLVLTTNGRIYSQPNSDGTPWFYSVGNLADNRWHHVVFTYNTVAGGTDAFYIDGVLNNSITHSGAWAWPAAQQIELGRSHDTYWYRLNGAMDDFRLYNRILTASEISQVYGAADDPVNPADIGLNLQAPMAGVNATAYLRAPFTVTDPAAFQSLRLTVRASDGFVAWINGQQVAALNAPASPAWNSTATASGLSGVAKVYDIPLTPGLLRAGANVLALQALNNTAADANLLVYPLLDGLLVNGIPQYLSTPTPGTVNSQGSTSLGPFIRETTNQPTRPAGGAGSAPLTITAKVAPSVRALAATTPVQLAWRIMFGAETLVTMSTVGDGTWTANIPTTALTAGQMLRWRIIAKDSTGVQSTDPPFASATDSDQYYGTVAPDGITTQLPVYHLFVNGYVRGAQTTADSDAGTRGSFFFGNQLYDNVFIRIKGDTTRYLNKRSHRVDFNSGHQFRWSPDQKPLKELALNSEYVDPSYSRQYLSMWMHRMTGTGATPHFPVRAQMNGAFWQLAFHTYTADSELLDVMGLDPNGALYASVGQLIPGGSGEKQTRVTESTADYTAFATAMGEGRTVAQRRTSLFDTVNLPAVINYLAVARFCQEGDDVWANMTVYRDSDRTGEWRIIPFDTNLSWGQLFYADYPSFNNVVHAANDNNKSHPLYGSNSCRPIYSGSFNRLYDAVIQVPETRAMLLRRMRSLMDQWVQPPSTSAASRLIETELDAHVARISQEAALDRTTWGWPPDSGPYGLGQDSLATGVSELKNLFLTPRRTHFFTTHSVTNTAKAVGIANANNAGIPDSMPATVPVTIQPITAAQFNPPGAVNQSGEYLQLTNPNTYAVDLSGWKLANGVRFTFAAGTVVNAGASIYVSPDVAAFRARTTSPKGGENLYVTGPYDGQLSARGETVELWNAAGTLVTSQTYTGTPTLAQQYLRLTELDYAPEPVTPAESAALPGVMAGDFEFIELLNSSSSPLVLTGARFTKGITYIFDATPVPANGRIILASRPAAFALRHPGVAVAGTFSGSLDNSGEEIELVDATGEVILDFSYDPKWFPPATGGGYTLVTRQAVPDYAGYSRATQWALSGTPGGSAGTGDTSFSSHFSGWRWDFFTKTEIEDPAVSGPEADPDGDGLTNAQEYAFGRNPRLPDNNGLATPALVRVDGADYETVTFDRARQTLDLTYTIETSTGLTGWNLAGGSMTTQALTPFTERVTWRNSQPVSGQGRVFLRVRASQ